MLESKRRADVFLCRALGFQNIARHKEGTVASHMRAQSFRDTQAWEDFDQGPPGVQPDSLHDSPSSPLRPLAFPSTSGILRVSTVGTTLPQEMQNNTEHLSGNGALRSGCCLRWRTIRCMTLFDSVRDSCWIVFGCFKARIIVHSKDEGEVKVVGTSEPCSDCLCSEGRACAAKISHNAQQPNERGLSCLGPKATFMCRQASL